MERVAWSPPLVGSEADELSVTVSSTCRYWSRVAVPDSVSVNVPGLYSGSDNAGRARIGGKRIAHETVRDPHGCGCKNSVNPDAVALTFEESTTGPAPACQTAVGETLSRTGGSSTGLMKTTMLPVAVDCVSLKL